MVAKDTVTCVSPSSLFSSKTGAFCSFVYLQIYFCKQEPQLASQKIRLPVMLENTLDGDTCITVSMVYKCEQ